MTDAHFDIGVPSIPGDPFTVETIEDQIKRAWSELGEQAERDGVPAPLRTSILTLVVVARGDRDIARATRTLHKLVQTLPSRVILFSIREGVDRITANVSAHCALRSGDRTACYELIEIQAGPGNLRAFPSILTQLDITDLTTFVWWVGDVETTSPSFERISGAAQRVIIDSSSSSSPTSTLRSYQGYVSANREIVAASDLTWSRLLVFRELVAQSFDVPAAQAMLGHLIRIDMSLHPAAMADALLLAGWISSRLDLTPESATRSAGSMTLHARSSDGRDVKFDLALATTGTRGIRSIRLHGHGRTQSSRVTIRRVDDTSAVVSIDVTGTPRQQRMVHCADEYDDQVLGLEIMQFGRDPIYEESLAHAATYSEFLDRERH